MWGKCKEQLKIKLLAAWAASTACAAAAWDAMVDFFGGW